MHSINRELANYFRGPIRRKGSGLTSHKTPPPPTLVTHYTPHALLTGWPKQQVNGLPASKGHYAFFYGALSLRWRVQIYRPRPCSYNHNFKGCVFDLLGSTVVQPFNIVIESRRFS